MSIPARFLDEMRDRLTLSEVAGRRLKLTRAGREFKACCPFHHEKSPSFYVNDDKQFYHCFGCGAHGDVIGFVMQNDNLSFIDAVEMLAAEAGMQVPKASPEAVAQSRKEKSLHALMDDAARFFEARLGDPRHRDALDYLRGRGIGEDLAAAFRLGFAPADGRTLVRHLRDLGYTEAQMRETGVARVRDGGESQAFFRDRLMFPVADRRGRVVAFGGRVLPDHLRPMPADGRKPPKYINSSETPLFHKGSMLYAEAHARQAAADGLPLVVVEGYVDVIACFGAGYRGAVAPLGTALTEEQILVLWKMIPAEEKLPVLCFDGDTAGRRAASRAASRFLPLLKPYHSALIAFLPEGQDPDSLIRGQGRRAFDAVIESAVPLAEFIWRSHTEGKRFETPEARAGLAAVLDGEAERIPDRAVQQYYRSMFRDRLFQAFGPRRAERSGGRPGGRTGSGPPAPVSGIPLRRPVNTARDFAGPVLLAALINHPHIYDAVEETLAVLPMEDSRLDGLRNALLDGLGATEGLDGETLRGHLLTRGFESELNRVLSPSIYTHAGFARPDAPQETVLAGWQGWMKGLHALALRRELDGEAKKIDNMNKINGLMDVLKAEY